MGEPKPYDPEDKPDPDAPRPKFERADWLVGSEDGLTAEMDEAEQPSRQMEAPKLARPRLADSDRAPSSTRVPRPVPPPASPAPASPAPAMPAWETGANSIPMMRRTVPPAGGGAASALPDLSREFPMDDAEERARVSAKLAEQQAQEAAIAARPHAVVKPAEFELPSVPLPWWARIPEFVRFDRRVQAGLLVVALVVLAITLWPREEKTISVAHLKEHADRYADTPVRVGGRVSEVFPVGGSWAFTLVQGRDTIVVFSRSRVPRQREKLVVVGTLSTGYLDGQSRVAIFESTR